MRRDYKITGEVASADVVVGGYREGGRKKEGVKRR